GGPPSRALRVVAGAEPVHDDDRVVAEHPRVVTARERRHGARPPHELRAVAHPDRELPGDVVLEVRRLAAVGLGDRPDVVRPAPSRLEDEPPDLGVPHFEDLRVSVRELADLVRLPEVPVLGVLHLDPSFPYPRLWTILTY